MVTPHRHDRGFAVVEILIAVAVLTVLALGLVGSERGSHAAARSGIEETAALALLQERLEVLRADPGAVPLGERSVDLSSPLLNGAASTERATLVEPGLVEIELRIHWRPAGTSTETERRLITWIAREEGR